MSRCLPNCRVVGVMDALKVQQADLVAHDIGNMVGYALAAQYPVRVTRWVVIDAPLPGIGDWDNIIRCPMLWHFDFRGPDEERLVQGRERIYLDRFWNELSGDPNRIDEDTRQHFAALYARPHAVHDAFEQFGAVRQDAFDNRGCSPRAARSPCRCSPSVPRSFSARIWPIICSSSPATSRAASCPTPGTGSWRRIHRPPSDWLRIFSPSDMGFRVSMDCMLSLNSQPRRLIWQANRKRSL